MPAATTTTAAINDRPPRFSSFHGKHGALLRVQPRPVPCPLPIVLGSSSSRRRAVMEELGWQFSTASPDIDEKAIRDADRRKMCAAIARAKARALAGRLDKHAVLVTADQVCLFDAEDGGGEVIREKPESVQEVAEGSHQSIVSWKEIPSGVVGAVVARGLVMSSAGGFSLEDPDLGPLVDNIEGSVDSVFGMPVDLLCTLIERAMVGAGQL